MLPNVDVQCFEHHDVWEFGDFPEVGSFGVKLKSQTKLRARTKV